VPHENRHKAWLSFVRKAVSVPIDYTIDDLIWFRDIAAHENPSLLRLVDSYIELAKRAETRARRARQTLNKSDAAQMHLFDLLREKKFFPMNSDLARFAARVVPRMRVYSFGKMARSDIAARIVEYVENSDPRARAALENSMREALASMKHAPTKRIDRQSFLSKWERIIKGLEL